MAPIFASPDIAEIVATFPPPLPKTNKSFVRSRSEGQLLDTSKTLHKLRLLLENIQGRVALDDLALLLDIENSDWVLECYDGGLSFDGQKTHLIPTTEVDRILDDLYLAAESEFVDLSAWATAHNIWQQSLDQARELALDHGERLPFETLAGNAGRRFVCKPALLGEAKLEVQRAIEVSSPDPCSLSSRLSKVPAAVLYNIAKDIISTGPCKGSLRTGSGEITFIPDDFETLQRHKAEQAIEARVRDILTQIEDGGFVKCQKNDGNDKLRDAMENQVQKSDSKMGVVIVDLHDSSWVVTSQEAVDNAIQALTANAKKQISLSWRHSKTDMPTSLPDERILSGLTEKKELPSHLLRSKHQKAVHASIAMTVSDLMAADRREFVLAIQERILTPINLYRNGVELIPEETTRERLDPYVANYLRTDIVEAAIQSLRADSLLRDKNRSKDIEKFSTAISACQSLADVSGAVAKLSRKQKLEEPDADLIRHCKSQMLQVKSKGLKKMARGSDVLQNATWVLLAQAAHGKNIDALFVSSGKDTSRMMKAYQLIGDTETGKKLESLRDALKAGQESKEDINLMKDVAISATSDMVKAGV